MGHHGRGEHAVPALCRAAPGTRPAQDPGPDTPGTHLDRGPGEFAEFKIYAGPVPDVTSLGFPATQTYDDGSVVEWNEPTPASGEEPEHPVPTLTVAATGDTDEADGATTGTSDESAATSTPGSTATVSAAASSGPASSDTDGTAVVLAVVGIVLAAAALLVGAVALRRRPTTPEKT